MARDKSSRPERLTEYIKEQQRLAARVERVTGRTDSVHHERLRELMGGQRPAEEKRSVRTPRKPPIHPLDDEADTEEVVVEEKNDG